MSKKIGILRVGTSGMVVPGNKQSLPAAFHDKSRLQYYASIFNTVEINSTFKKIPRLSTLEKWEAEVPDDFQFTLKVNKEITHTKQLTTTAESFETFMTAANHMRNKQGCLLIQFPGSITSTYIDQAENIISRLKQFDEPGNWRIAVEFRSPSWYNDSAFEMLEQYNASLVLHDMPKSKIFEPPEPVPFIYYRFHGIAGDYRGNYSDEYLKEHAHQLKQYLQQGKDVYVYFNNTMGNAFGNALTLKELVGQ